MTKAKADVDDNGGRCEICSLEESKDMVQSTVSIFCGGGLGWSQMWVCSACLPKWKEREANEKLILIK